MTVSRRTPIYLALACAGAAILLALSDLSTTFEFIDPGGEAEDSVKGGERHNYAQLVLGIFALAALTFAVVAGSQPAALAVAVAGAIGLLIFLVGDLPDINKVGTFDDESNSFENTKAEARQGFWLQLFSSLVLTVTGGALASLRPAQLRLFGGGGAPRPPRRRRIRARGQAEEAGEPAEAGRAAGQSAFRWPSRPRSRGGP